VKTAGAVAGILLAAGISIHGLAQTVSVVADHSDVQFVSSFVRPGQQVPCDCNDEGRIFAENLVHYPRPGDWHWIIMCDEAGWQRFLQQSGRVGHEEIYASTDLMTRTTYLRGTKLLHSSGFRAQPDEIIAHELAHIWLHSQDEAAAEGLARLWTKNIPVRSASSLN
jgi:hypothetical protein